MSRSTLRWSHLFVLLFVPVAWTEPFDPGASDYTGHKGATVYVSSRGDNSDGRSWATAFHTIQAALLAVPDDQGGHRVLVAPGTYAEANLYPSFKGAQGSYNLLIGDTDGAYGSGQTGHVVIDSGAPAVVVRTNPNAPTGNPTWMILDQGDPAAEWGLKSVDWWGPWKCAPEFSGIIWDRWIFRNLYVTGSEGGMGVDITNTKGSEFSFVVDRCVGIGRFAGAAVMAHKPRAGEPVVFRNSYFANLDWWGDAGAVYVRGEDHSMPDVPHATFENCTLVGPDNALQAGYPGVDELYTRVRFKDCKLIVLNFSQPHGTPSTGVICCGCKKAEQLHVDFEDCTLMGYQIFGATEAQGRKLNGNVSYAVKGKVRAYVQYRQPVPQGMERLRYWPVETFDDLIPDRWVPASDRPRRPVLVKIPTNFGAAMENTPFVYKGTPYLALNHRNDAKDRVGDYASEQNMHLYIQNLNTGARVARFGAGHSFVSAFVDGDMLRIFASQGTNDDWFQSIYQFTTTDMQHWDRKLAIPLEGDEHLFNCSVTRGEKEYVMAYESNQPVAFCFRFARSKDLDSWEKVPGLIFTGVNNEYSACPVLRYFAPYYYVIYLHAAIPGHNGWVPFLARSRDLIAWDLSPFNPIMEAAAGEGINNSDIDLFEYERRTYVYYATGDQATWGTVRIAMYDGPMRQFYESHFPEDAAMVRVSTQR
ncbi:MAG: hypothetical protein RBS72_02675 [Sedimentisphaerales bacterium]|jgi:hypothetical protein|nr:hypothetical protein [Sedimentisphaerales bacterium]HNY77253.1 hypothetical protein [Sedimentisphaerales bacterium]HOC62143.1 hypothetical protein [Sedimentisphaerales bacterium]HOH63470.1 hypothetical protein [Sedimentisphaerales bacterium]HPY52098.1 hypothetical protein [Sedimentisphaerales bacterium]